MHNKITSVVAFYGSKLEGLVVTDFIYDLCWEYFEMCEGEF